MHRGYSLLSPGHARDLRRASGLCIASFSLLGGLVAGVSFVSTHGQAGKLNTVLPKLGSYNNPLEERRRTSPRRITNLLTRRRRAKSR